MYCHIKITFSLTIHLISSCKPSAWWARCCPTATSERRRIQSRADYYYIALREASIRRSRWDNALPTKCDYYHQQNTLSTEHAYSNPQQKKQRHVSASLLSQLLFSAKFRLQPTSNYCRLSPVANFRATTLVPFRAVLAERTPRQSYA